MSKLEQIMDIFAGFGKQHTPVAIIQNGTTPQEKIVCGNVRDIALRAQYERISNPAIIIVGDVVKLASTSQLLAASASATCLKL